MTYEAIAYERSDKVYHTRSHYIKEYSHIQARKYPMYSGSWELYDISIDGVPQIWGSRDIEWSLRYYEREHRLPVNSITLLEIIRKP